MNYRTLILLTLLLILFSCKNKSTSDTPSEIPAIIEGAHLSIDEVRDYFPSQYFEEADLIYVNEDGTEKKLTIRDTDGIIDRTREGVNYTTEQFKLTIYNEADLRFGIVIIGSVDYDQNNTAGQSIGANLMPFNEGGTTWNNIDFENGQPTVTIFDDFRETFTALGRTFNDVYVAVPTPHIDAYSELDINSEVGVVAFRDEYNQLWVFDRFE